MNGSSSNTSGANQAKFRFVQKGDQDRIPQAVIDELARRGFVQLEVTVQGNVLIQPDEPEDKTKVWWKSDINGVPLGQPLSWHPVEGKWLPLDKDFVPYVPPAQRNGTTFAAAGGSTVTFGPFATMGTVNYLVTLTPSLFWDGVWHTPPGSFPAGFGYFIANKAADLFTVQFYGIPVGGLAWDWQVTALPTP